MTREDEGQDTKSERLHMFISPAEVEAIEDWRFENRVSSKSEAVRRLCQIGLAHSRDSKQIEKSSERALRILFRAVDKLGKERSKSPTEDRLKAAHLALVAVLESQIELQRDVARFFVSEKQLASRNTEIEHAVELTETFRAMLDNGQKS